MGHYDHPIKAITLLALLVIKKLPNMKFVICIAALALMATIEAAPATETGSYGSETAGDGSKYFASELDGIQGALKDISAAGTDLTTIETKLENIVDGSADIYAAA